MGHIGYSGSGAKRGAHIRFLAGRGSSFIRCDALARTYTGRLRYCPHDKPPPRVGLYHEQRQLTSVLFKPVSVSSTFTGFFFAAFIRETIRKHLTGNIKSGLSLCAKVIPVPTGFFAFKGLCLSGQYPDAAMCRGFFLHLGHETNSRTMPPVLPQIHAR